MLGYHRFLFSFCNIRMESQHLLHSTRISLHRLNSASNEDAKLHGFLNYMEQLKNYERIGVPKDAGTDSDDGFDLGRMRRLLQRLGNPHFRFKAIHVAGTKGKGSTTAFISNILREQGYLVGCYTSPHLLSIRERISLEGNGEPVSVDLLRDIFDDIKGILDLSIQLEGGAITHFEVRDGSSPSGVICVPFKAFEGAQVFTALAFALFSQQGVDVAVIEAGLGGARDATNVLRSAELAASVITSVGEEHLSALGGSLESIALAKSGIIKPGCPVVIGGPLQPHIEHIFRNKASLLNSPLVSAYVAGTKSNIRFFEKEEIPYQCCEIHISIEEAMPLFLNLPDVKLQMLGKHQLQNAITATCIALCLQNSGWMISNQAIKTGLEKTCLPGRGQYLTKKETEILGLTRVSILIDGAHTEASAKGLTDLITLQNPDGVLALVVSMASDKDHMAFAMQLLTGRRPDIVILTETSIAGSRFRSTSASSLKDAWLRAAACLGINALDLGTMSHWKKAEGLANNEQVLLICNPNAMVGDCLQLAEELLGLRSGERPHFIVVTGSLHIVSSVLALLQH